MDALAAQVVGEIPIAERKAVQDGHAHERVGATCGTSPHLVQLGELSAGRQALEPASLAVRH